MPATIEFKGYPFDLIRLEIKQPHGIICRIDHTARGPERLRLGRAGDGAYAMTRADPAWSGGNITWFDDVGNVLSWIGPIGRSAPPRLFTTLPWPYGPSHPVPNYSAFKLRRPGRWNIANPTGIGSWYAATILRSFDRKIWMNGRLLAVVPENRLVLGAALMKTSRHDYLVAVTTLNDYNLKDSRGWISQEDYPQILHDEVVYTRLDRLPQNPKASPIAWTSAGIETYDAYPGALPRTGCYFFSASGTRAASMIPCDGYPTRYPSDLAEVEPRNDLISRITLTAIPDVAGAEETLTATFSITEQAETFYQETVTTVCNYAGGDPGFTPYEAATTHSGSLTGAASAIVAIDYKGETELTARASYTRTKTFQSNEAFAGEEGYFAFDMTSLQQESARMTLTMGERQITLIDSSTTEEYSYHYDGGNTATEQTHGISQEWVCNVFHLDLRSDKIVLAKELLTKNKTNAVTWHDILMTSEYVTGDYAESGLQEFAIHINEVQQLKKSYPYSASSSGPITEPRNRPSGDAVYNRTETFTHVVSLTDLVRQHFYWASSNDYIYQVMELPYIKVSSNGEGDILVSNAGLNRTYCSEYNGKTADPIDFLAFTGGNIDAIYAAYQAEKYPPNPNNPGDPNNTVDTALESKMKPEFTV